MNPKKKEIRRFLLRNAMHDLVIVRNMRPKSFQILLDLLNRKLGYKGQLLALKMLRDEYIDWKKYEEEFQQIFGEHFKSIITLGSMAVLQQTGLQLRGGYETLHPWESIFKERVFKASKTTLDRLRGDILPKIQESMVKGYSHTHTTGKLEESFVDMTRSSLERVARTETHSVYNHSRI